ncbi:MAG: ATP-binding protein [Calditrichaeota bacterium]|nr:MAG: ATP-binding protein [Calditrichota bacterium]
MAITRLSAEKLRRKIGKKALPFNTTDDLQPLDSIIGQERALKALKLALEVDASGYNVFVTGFSGTGRTTIIEKILRDYAAKQPVPNDWCYVYNFLDPDAPRALSLPAGKGNELKADMEHLISTLRQEFKRAFTSEHYENQKAIIMNQINQEKREILQRLEEEAKSLGLQVQPTPMGIRTVIMRNGKPLTQEEFEQLPSEEKEAIARNIEILEGKIAETLRLLARVDMAAQKTLRQLDRDVAGFLAEQYVNEIKEKYQDFSQVLQYLDAVREDIVSNSSEFLAELDREADESKPKPQNNLFKRYKVNVVVDNSDLQGAPVIHETNPTYNNLIGRIEKYPVSGTFVTDFTMIKPGSLLKANGGYIMMDALDVMTTPFVYEALKRSLKNKQVRIEDINEVYGTLALASLKPQPIPLKVKVVLIGWNRVYQVLRKYDDDFPKIFKIRADFDYETDSTPKAIQQYARFVKKVIDEEKLIPFHREAVEEIIQYGHRLASDQKKISLEFGQIVKIIQEATFWAREKGSNIVRAEDVEKAVQEYEYRHSLYKEKIQEYIQRNIHKIIVTGEAVGEINGLSVYDLGDISFGKPSRITAKTYIGNENFVNIERKAGLTGKIHDKGTYILSGFFNSKFGEYMPIAFSGSLAFEQSYSRIDGDSASSTELYALLSSLSGVPIKQGIAVTGSVNQNGEIQAIGGVNEKIEGFYEVCKFKGLTGEQGVIIPRSNVDDLMLKSEVREAVKEGKFHIWAIDTVEDGLKLLTGKTAGRRGKSGRFTRNSIYDLVEKRLKEFAYRADNYRKLLGETKKKKNNEGEKRKNNNNNENND